MQGRVILLLEEPSMKTLLDTFLPRLFPGWQYGQHFQCVAHEGKSDLDRSIPRKLRAWREPNVRFVILRDNDNADCVDLKTRFTALCTKHGRPETLVRLVCQELESWYIGDLCALAEAFENPKLDVPALHKQFAQPDNWQKPSVQVRRLVPSFQKIGGARAMATCLREGENLSHSFHIFVNGLRRIADEMGYAEDAH